MSHVRKWQVALALFAVSGCSPSSPADETQSPNASAEVDSTNLSPERALELVEELRGRTRRPGEDNTLRTAIRYARDPAGIQWMLDSGFAEGTADNWHATNGVVVDPNSFLSAINVPTHRRILSVDGISTEGKKATIRWREAYEPIEPAYNIVCNLNTHALVGRRDCSYPPATGTLHVTREDDGTWRIGGY